MIDLNSLLARHEGESGAEFRWRPRYFFKVVLAEIEKVEHVWITKHEIEVDLIFGA
jgi:phage-related protein